MNIRKNAKDLSDTEIGDFIAALKQLKSEVVTTPNGSQINHYDVFSAIHLGVTYKTKNGNPLGPGERNGGHGNAAFLSWHREFLRRIEGALQKVSKNSSLSIPYWDWTDHNTTFKKVFTDNFMGPDGTGRDVSVPGIGVVGKTLNSGPFTKASGWEVDGSVHLYRAHMNASLGDELSRALGNQNSLPEEHQINTLFSLNDYNSFRKEIETGAEMHNDMHYWVRGSMLAHSSPVDPIFLLNHANIDRIWALWQSFGHSGSSYYPKSGEPEGHNLTDSMWPWDGGATGVETQSNIWGLIPRITDDVKPLGVLDCKQLGYGYVGWGRVKEILDTAISNWSDRTGVAPALSVHNPTGIFGWSTQQELLDSSAFDFRLVEPSKIGNNMGFETNLIKVLKGELPGAPRMPKGGPYISDYQVSEIAHWIDSGAPS